MRRLQLLVRQSVAFGAEQYGDASGCAACFLHRSLGTSPGFQHPEIVVTLPGSRRQDQSAISNCFRQCRNDTRCLEQVVGPRGTCSGLRMREFPRIDQDQVGQSHVLHGARDCPDIAGMRRFDEDEADR